jgi:hypothetical protein
MKGIFFSIQEKKKKSFLLNTILKEMTNFSKTLRWIRHADRMWKNRTLNFAGETSWEISIRKTGEEVGDDWS